MIIGDQINGSFSYFSKFLRIHCSLHFTNTIDKHAVVEKCKNLYFKKVNFETRGLPYRETMVVGIAASCLYAALSFPYLYECNNKVRHPLHFKNKRFHYCLSSNISLYNYIIKKLSLH